LCVIFRITLVVESHLLCHTLYFFVSLFKFWQLGSALVMQHITPGSRLNAVGVFHRFSNPLSPSTQNIPRMRKPSNDANNASKIGDDNAASISLTSLMGLLRSTWAAAREKTKVDDDTFLAAGLLRSSWEAAREKKKVDNDTLLAAGSLQSS
jgi:hypothetical protein